MFGLINKKLRKLYISHCFYSINSIIRNPSADGKFIEFEKQMLFSHSDKILYNPATCQWIDR